MAALQPAPLTNLMTSVHSSLRDLGRPFWYLWLGGTIRMLGAQLMQFALGVWVYERTGSVLNFAGIVLAGLLPQLLTLPIAGSIVDRLNRRTVVIVADLAAALLSVSVVLLLWRDRLEVIHLYAFMLVAALMNAFRHPAYRALVGTILRNDQLTRASGLLGISTTALGIVAPALAGAMMVTIGLTGLATLHLLTFVAGATFTWRALPHRSVMPAAIHGGILGVLNDSVANFRTSLAFFRRSASMAGLLFYSLIQRALLALVATLAAPLILANHSSQSLGLILSSAAGGSLVGSMLMALLRSPKRRAAVILACDAILACCIVSFGLVDSLPGYCLLQAIGSCVGTVGASCAFALWMTKAPEAQRGSILVVENTAATACTALVVLSGATIVHAWLEPALAPGRILAGIGELLLNVANERGIAMLFVLSGTLGLLASLGGYAFKPLRNLE